MWHVGEVDKLCCYVFVVDKLRCCHVACGCSGEVMMTFYAVFLIYLIDEDMWHVVIASMLR